MTRKNMNNCAYEVWMRRVNADEAKNIYMDTRIFLESVQLLKNKYICAYKEINGDDEVNNHD